MKKDSKNLSKQDLKIIGLSSLGGTLEFYDFIIVFFFVDVISALFFPKHLGEFWAIVNTYGTFAAAYFARPLGGIIMAHFGDKFGRKNMFMLSILLMVIPTFALAFTPTFDSIGYIAPIFLLIVRLSQGIAIGGELPGAWVFVYEHAKSSHKNTYLGLLTASVVGGILCGSIVALLINIFFSKEEIMQYAWRIPFALGGIFGIVSIYLRKFLQETPIFKEMHKENKIESFPLKEVLKTSRPSVILSMLITWVLTGCILIFILLMPTKLLGDVVPLDSFSKTYIQIAGLVAIVSACVLSGILADKFNPSSVCIAFSVGFIIFSYLFFRELYYVDSRDFGLLIFYYCGACFFGGIMNFCPIFMNMLFSDTIRFSGVSFSYNIAYALAGGLTPSLAFIMHSLAKNGNPNFFCSHALSFYVLLLGFLAIFVSMAIIKFKRN